MPQSCFSALSLLLLFVCCSDESEPAKSPAVAAQKVAASKPADEGAGVSDSSTSSERGVLGVSSMPAELIRELGLSGQGMVVGLIALGSPADLAGLRTGDCVTTAQRVRLADFAGLVDVVSKLGAGNEVTMEVLRGGRSFRVAITLESVPSKPRVLGYKSAVAYLRSVNTAGPRVCQEIAEHLLMLERLDEAIAELKAGARSFSEDGMIAGRLLGLLRKNGYFKDYVTMAEGLDPKTLESPRIRHEYCLALFLSGRFAAAVDESVLTLKQLANAQGLDRDLIEKLAASLVGVWFVASCRLGASLDSDEVDAWLLRLPSSSQYVECFSFFVSAMGAELAYTLSPGAKSTTVPLRIDPDTGVGRMAIEVNGETLDQCLIDTGAGMTVLSSAAAKKAGVIVGQVEAASMIGWMEGKVVPGFLETLRVGDVVFDNVPVLVGHDLPFSVYGIEAALGIDVMHHLRLTIKNADGSVRVEPSRDGPIDESADWSIPLWCFRGHVLCDAERAGQPVRVILDTGNYQGSYLLGAWARRHIKRKKTSWLGSLVGVDTNEYLLKGLKLGGRVLPDWPVSIAPTSGKIYDQIADVLMGQDLLSDYDVVIDMRRRVMQLREL